MAIPKPTHDAAWWAAKTAGMDFSKEDLNDPYKFNRIIWEGIKGTPYPKTNSVGLRPSGTPQPDSKEAGKRTASTEDNK